MSPRPFEIDRQLFKRFIRPGMSQEEIQLALAAIGEARIEAYARYNITNEEFIVDLERLAEGDARPNGPNVMWSTVRIKAEGDGDFLGSKNRLSRAREHLDALQAEEKTLQSSWSGSTRIAYDENGNPSVVITDGGKPDVSRLSLLLGDFLHNLRVALDLAVSELCRLFGGDDKRVSFPHDENEQKLADRIDDFLNKGRKASDGPRPGYDEISAILLKLAPHDEANFLLRAVAIFDNENKHRQMIVASGRVSGAAYQFGTPREEAEKERPLSIQFQFPLESYLDGFPLIETCHEMAACASKAVEHIMRGASRV